MTDTTAESAEDPRTPLIEAELDELEQLYRGGEETALEWRAAALAAHPFLLAEVRRGRAALAARDALWREALRLAGYSLSTNGHLLSRGFVKSYSDDPNSAPLRALLSEGEP